MGLLRQSVTAALCFVLVSLGAALPCQGAPAADAASGGTEQAAPEAGVNTDQMAKAAQNPIASVTSLPFQFNANFGNGPNQLTTYTLNIQPVIPFAAGDLNLISRIILPVANVPDSLVAGPTTGPEVGIGDTQYTLFFSPAKPARLIWGIGPAVVFPTATDTRFGSGKWQAGPGFVALTMQGHMVYGALVQQLWSFADAPGTTPRPAVSAALLQPFFNYNMARGWYLTTSPIITANWNAANHADKWTVPVGGGLGRVFVYHGQPMNAQFQLFYNVVRPGGGPSWTARAQLQFLFFKKKRD